MKHNMLCQAIAWHFVPVLVLLTCTQFATCQLDHPIIPAYERFPSQQNGLAAGRLLLGELNCVACHQSSTIKGRPAPNLKSVAGRVSPDYLQQFIANPNQTKPGTTMPNLFHHQSPTKTAEEVEAIVHYLGSLTNARPTQQTARIGSKARGKAIYETVGCLACHDDKQADSKPLPTSVPQGDLSTKYSLPSLANFLRTPHEARPAGRMPSLNLSEQQADDVASYLLPNVPEQAGIAFAEFRGPWKRIPDFRQMTPTSQGGTETFNARAAGGGDHFGLRFEAQLEIPRSGTYHFHLGSDDGSKLWIDKKLLIDNDGEHSMKWLSKTIDLDAGIHPITLDYIEIGGGEELELEIEGPGLKRRKAHELVLKEISVLDQEKPLLANPSLVSKGQLLFQKKGCIHCHPIGKSQNALATPNLLALNVERGCLAEPSPPNAPLFAFSPQQRETLNQAIRKRISGTKLTAAEKLSATLQEFNCIACHERGGMGGVEQARNPHFVSTQPEMGDEGRLPPTLDHVGEKLKPKWLTTVLTQGAQDRPYMKTRMPQFQAPEVEALGNLFAKLDHVEGLPEIPLTRKESRKAGWKMVGNKGFSCIKCHTFGKYNATGIQAISMTTMNKRLQEDWFRRYVRNPQIYRRGTRMPSAWPTEGESLLPEILAGNSDRQIQAVWNYLADGDRARVPFGLVTNSMELVPTDKAIIYRNFIQGAGPRAIGVGFPEQVSLAFDAEGCRLALIWQGSFIDAKRHWTGRGQGFEPPAGGNLITFADGPEFALLASKDATWPSESELAFRGYRLSDDNRPTFFYQLKNLSIQDTPNAMEDEKSVGLTRTFKIQSNGSTPGIWHRAAVGQKIEANNDHQFLVDDTLQIKFPTSTQPRIRNQQGKQELLLYIPLTDQDATFTQTYTW